MFEKLQKSPLMFWSLEILIVVAIIYVSTKISFMFSPVAIFISTIFMPILLSGILFYMLNPIVKAITEIKIRGKNISRTLAVSIVFILAVGVLAAIFIGLVPKLLSQITNLANHAPGFINDIRDIFENTFKNVDSQPFFEKFDLGSITNKFSKNIMGIINSTINGLTTGIGGIISTAANVVIIAVTVPIVLFYMLKDGGKLAPTIAGLLPANHRSQIMELLFKMSNTLSKYIGGQMIECLFVATFTAIGYLIIGIPYALLLGVIAGICNIIPYLGPYIGIAPALAVSVTNGGWMSVVYNIIVVIVVQQIDGNLVYPNVIGKSLDIHPLTIIIILLAAGNIAGLMGMILAIPLYAIVKVVVIHLYTIYQLR